MCSESIDYKKYYELELIKNSKLEKEIKLLKQEDSCYKLLKDITCNNIIELELPQRHPCLFYLNPEEPVKMVTVTFDPKKFPNLTNRTAQRAYIRESLEELSKKIIGPDYRLRNLYGCYEIHETGVVHSHFITDSITLETLNKLQMYFTDNKHNLRAIHCCDKSYREARDYINKKETKDKNCLKNYYIFDKNNNPDFDLSKKTSKNLFSIL